MYRASCCCLTRLTNKVLLLQDNFWQFLECTMISWPGTGLGPSFFAGKLLLPLITSYLEIFGTTRENYSKPFTFDLFRYRVRSLHYIKILLNKIISPMIHQVSCLSTITLIRQRPWQKGIISISASDKPYDSISNKVQKDAGLHRQLAGSYEIIVPSKKGPVLQIIPLND